MEITNPVHPQIKASEIPDTDTLTGFPVPEFVFDSYELALFHRTRKTQGDVTSCVFDGELYIVNHGKSRTLNRLVGGKRNSHIQDIVEGE